MMSLVTCPICSQRFDPERSDAMPFCSNRCRMIDLGRWLSEDYGLPHTPDPDDEELFSDEQPPPNHNGS